MSLDVSRETEDKLQAYKDLLIKWNSKINLISPSTVYDISERHIADSLQLAAHVAPKSGIWADLGSGGGLPGLVLAIYYANTQLQFILVESDQRKATFLRTVMRELNLNNTQVIANRIETVNPLKAAYISARALAPMHLLVPYLHRHLAQNGQAWLLKGEKWQSEVEEVRKKWRFNLTAMPSKTHEHGAILKIDGISHA